jgi:hypothetical protein
MKPAGRQPGPQWSALKSVAAVLVPIALAVWVGVGTAALWKGLTPRLLARRGISVESVSRFQRRLELDLHLAPAESADTRLGKN